MTIDEFQSLTDSAFSFLFSGFGYSAQPAQRGGRFNSGFVRTFARDDLTIGFLFGDADSSHLCTIWFDDGIPARVQRRHMDRTLAALLLDRHPSYVHKSSRDISDDESAMSAIREYASLLREFAEEAINGDFSAFPALVFMVIYFEDEKRSLQGTGRPLGIFSSLELADTAIANRQRTMAGLEHADGYEIWRMDIDPRWLTRPEREIG